MSKTDLHPGPWLHIGWDDGFVRDANGEIICMVDDLETRSIVAAAPTMLEFLEELTKGNMPYEQIVQKASKLVDEVRNKNWQTVTNKQRAKLEGGNDCAHVPESQG